MLSRRNHPLKSRQSTKCMPITGYQEATHRVKIIVYTGRIIPTISNFTVVVSWVPTEPEEHHMQKVKTLIDILGACKSVSLRVSVNSGIRHRSHVRSVQCLWVGLSVTIMPGSPQWCVLFLQYLW